MSLKTTKELKKIISNSIKESIDLKKIMLENDELDLPLYKAGDLPEPFELYDLLGGKKYNIKFNRHDKLIWDYAMLLSHNPLAGSLAPGKGFHASLHALINVPTEEDLYQKDFEKVERMLDEWYILYPDEDIKEQAFKMAEKIIEELGIVWIHKDFWRPPLKEQLDHPERIDYYEKLMNSTGISYRELLEDVIDILDQKTFQYTIRSLRNKYGFSF